MEEEITKLDWKLLRKRGMRFRRLDNLKITVIDEPAKA